MSSLPLPRGYFRCPPLSPVEVDDLLATGSTACDDTLRNALSMAATTPARVLRHPRTQRYATIYHGPDVVEPAVVGTTGVTQVEATRDDLVSFFDLTSPKQLRTYSNVLALSTLDRCALYTLVEQGSDLVYAGVHWAAIELPAMLTNRDACFLEAMKEVVVDDPFTGEGRRCIVRTLHSIELSYCPSLDASHHLTRASILRSGHVFVESATANVWDYYLVYVTKPNGKMPAFLNLKCNIRHVHQMLHLEEHFCRQRWAAKIDTRVFQPITSPRASAPLACGVCDHRLSLWRSQRRHCHACGEYACRHCSHTWDVQLPYKVFPVHLCVECFTGSPLRPPSPPPVRLCHTTRSVRSEPGTLSSRSSATSRSRAKSTYSSSRRGSFLSTYLLQLEHATHVSGRAPRHRQSSP